MAKKYLSLEGLAEYDALIKAMIGAINRAVAQKSQVQIITWEADD